MIKKLVLRIFLVWLGVGVFFLGRLYWDGSRIWEEEASGYPTRHEYIVLNNVALFSHLALKAGVADDSWLSLWLEGIAENAYQDGIRKIPEEDAERLHWRYLRYLRPYQGGFVKLDELSNRKKLVDEALIVATQYPYKKARNQLIMARYAFEEATHAFLLANFRYAAKDNPTKEEIKQFVVSIEKMHETLASNFLLHASKDIELYKMSLLYSMELASAVILYNWNEEGYTCDSEIVDAYVRLRTHFLERVQKVISSAAVAQIDVTNISKYQPGAETILTTECNITFNEGD